MLIENECAAWVVQRLRKAGSDGKQSPGKMAAEYQAEPRLAGGKRKRCLWET